MSASKKRIAFITLFRDAYPDKGREECIRAANTLLRLAKQHGRMAVEECNGPPDWIHSMPMDQKVRRTHIDEWADDLAKRQARVHNKILAHCAEWKLPVKLGGDPRGHTVKVFFPKDERGIRPSNTWGGQEDGYGVPQ